MSVIFPDWQTPAGVKCAFTTRTDGCSAAPWNSFNLGMHVGDNSAHVASNRERLTRLAHLPAAPSWLEQVHGTDVVTLPAGAASLVADAAYTCKKGVVCSVMTADCLPVLFCSRDGNEVAAAHAGWRGLCAGVLENTLKAFNSPARDINVWLGPAIGPDAFEVGSEVREAFMLQDPAAAFAFRPHGGRYFADLWLLARQRLEAAGVGNISGGGHCTWHDAGQFFSYRRDGITGRMASLIWLI